MGVLKDLIPLFEFIKHPVAVMLHERETNLEGRTELKEESKPIPLNYLAHLLDYLCPWN